MQPAVHPLKQLSIVHSALIGAQLILAAVLIFLVKTGSGVAPMADQQQIFQIICVVTAMAGFIGGTQLFKRRLMQTRDALTTSAQDKFLAYRTSSIILWAMLEMPGLLCLIFFYLSHDYALLILAAALLFLFFIFAPSRQKLKLYLGLQDDEIDGLQ